MKYLIIASLIALFVYWWIITNTGDYIAGWILFAIGLAIGLIIEYYTHKTEEINKL
nr:hypothetical protein [uncultured archaeon]